MAALSSLKYSRSHEWVQPEGKTAKIGITSHAAEELGDVALVLLPEVGRILQAGEKFGEIESIKAVSDLYAPVSGQVIAVNDELNTAPENINDDPYGSGWMLEIQMEDISDLEKLMDSAAYEKLVQEA